MGIIVVVTALALLEYVWFGFQVGSARGKYGVAAPAIAGDPIFERHMRVHQNTLENLIIFVPAIWMSAHFVGVTFAALLGVVFIVGRAIYAVRYVAEPESRTVGVIISFGANMVMLVGALIGGTLSLF